MNARNQKSTLLTFLLIPWIILWSTLNRWLIPAQPNTKLRVIAPKNKKPKLKKPSKKSTYIALQQTLPVAAPVIPVVDALPKPEPEIPKLLTFSAVYTPPSFLSAKTNVTSVLKAVQAEKPLEETPEVKAYFQRIKQNIALCQIIKSTHVSLLAKSPFTEHTPLTDFVTKLAFAYRFNKMLIGFKVLSSKKGIYDSFYNESHEIEIESAREELNQARNMYVHNILFHLADDTLLSSLKEILSGMDFEILDTLNARNTSLNLFEHFTCLHNSPLYKNFVAEDRPLKHDYDFKSDQAKLKEWLTSYIIPISNTIQSMLKTTSFQVRQECYDALKMLLMIGGEFCPSTSERERRNNKSSIQRYIQACRSARNHFSHHVFTNKYYYLAEMTVKKGMLVNNSTVATHHDFYQDLIPAMSANNVLIRKKSR